MMTARQRNAVLKRMYDYFNSTGRIMTEQEYIHSDGPVRYLAIKKGFRSYNSMVAILKKRYPKWDLAKREKVVKKKVKKEVIEEKVADPLAALAKKRSERVESDDE